MHPAEKLTKKDIEMFSALLEDEQKKILRHLENLSDSSETELTPSASGDSADLAALEISQSNLQKIGKREQYLLKKIELAIEKIQAGTFGDCENCGDPIGVARLKARPVAQLCIDCKTEQESVERKFTSRDFEGGGDDDAEGDEESE
jgi:DnaK suppressor protein